MSSGAGQVIAIDPVRYRREFALKMGATMVLDPVAEGDGLVERVRELCRGPNDRRFAGGASWGRAGNAVMARGADFVVEAAGLQAFPPKVEAQPDPTNVKTVQQAWDCTRMGGHVMLMGFTLQPVSFPGASLALLGRTIHPGQQGGLHVHARHPAVREADREGNDRREVDDHEALHAREQPPGGAGHRRSHDHHRRHRVRVKPRFHDDVVIISLSLFVAAAAQAQFAASFRLPIPLYSAYCGYGQSGRVRPSAPLPII